MSNLAARLTTAAVLVPGVLFAVLVDSTLWGVLALAVFGGMFALDEYLRMSLTTNERSHNWGVRIATGLAGATLLVVATLGEHPQRVTTTLIVGALGVAVVVLLRRQALAHAGRDLAAALSGLLYVSALLIAVPAFKRDLGAEVGGAWLLVTLGIAFMSDTVAYFFGRAFGRHPLYPQVSPKKTVEGSIGGLMGGCLSTFGFGVWWLLPELAWHHALILGVLGSALGQCGDLVESAIKRTYGCKDSGSLLPGHGGMLDRIDALLFVAPAVYTYVTFAIVRG